MKKLLLHNKTKGALVMKNSMKVFSALLLIGVVVTTGACSKSSDNGASAQPPVAPLCTQPGGCPPPGSLGNAALLISASGTSSGYYAQIDIAMDILGVAGQFDPNNPKAAIFYKGPATLAGYLRITGTTGVTSICGAPAGEYLMATTQPGTMYSATYTGGTISGGGPGGVRLDAEIIQGVLYNNQDPMGTSKGSTTNRLFLQMVIKAVNGQPCNMAISTI
jgi:hypothetical protein